ncbi:cobalamin-dependent protein [Aquibacillus rhizosphaerae]|uniref:Cobalamin-dependent protein n=1 Tax=Aquibacillus rhizosphaerae TaxID=3051431 RepID=A0ABT7L4E1_9BACI|nr:cobalamin-dependent protein [Aquibacillus sp. LR5S19]MDL4840718.1 cobalamin-dependent protein [Aquibacillus sp. LR5S19]
MKKHEQIRVLIGKVGLDGHNRGAIILAKALREKGMYTVYSGLRQSPEQIAAQAMKYNVDIIGLSSLSGAHRSLFPKVASELSKLEGRHILIIGGGLIPDSDIAFLEKRGITKVFNDSNISIEEIVNSIEQLVFKRKYSLKN